MHSWRVLILPFLARQQLYSQYRFDEPWNGPHNLALANEMPSVYSCPSDFDSEPPKTNYAMIVGPHTFSDGPTARRYGEITDGTSNTIILAECAGAGINWLEPRDLDTEKMTYHIQTGWNESQPRTSDISSCHPSETNVGFCDGSVRFFTGNIDPEKLKALITIDGGEKVSLE